MKPPELPLAVVYRTGGHLRCTWRRTTTVHMDSYSACTARRSLEIAGYKALIIPVDTLDFLGLPVGWDSKSVDWQADTIKISPHQTDWTSCKLLRFPERAS